MSSKLNNISKKYLQATNNAKKSKEDDSEDLKKEMTEQESKEGPEGDEESESKEKQALEDKLGTEKNKKKGKKLDFTREGQGLTTTIYKNK